MPTTSGLESGDPPHRSVCSACACAWCHSGRLLGERVVRWSAWPWPWPSRQADAVPAGPGNRHAATAEAEAPCGRR